MKIILPLLFALILSGCAIKPKMYHFECKDQNPDVVFTYFPQALTSIGYDVKNINRDNNTFEAIKPIKITNKIKGVQYESILIIVRFYFDSKKSEISQFYINEFNGKKKITSLPEEQKNIYEKDVLKLLEKTLFYCNPEFKGR